MTTLKNTLKYSVLTGIFIIPFIPFLVPTSMFFPFIVGKGFTFRIIVEIIFGLSVILAFMDSNYRPNLSWISKSILLFAVSILVADIFGENVSKSLWSNYERMEGFVLIAHLVLYYFTLSSVLNTKKLWNYFINTHLVASGLMTLYSFSQLAGWAKINQGGVRVDGTFGNAAYLAIYLVFCIFLCLFMLSNSSFPKWQRWMYGVLAFLQTIVLYYTATRGAILGLIGGFLITTIIVLWKEKDNKLIRNISIYIVSFIAVVVLLFISIRHTDFVKNSQVLSRFSNLSFAEFKTQGRYFVWPMAIKGFTEKPVLGWGQENFNFVFNKYYNPQMFGQEEWFDRTHNIVLDWLIAGGLIGLSSYLLIYVALFYLLWRKKTLLTNSEKAIITGMIFAYIFHNMFVFDNLISYIMFFTILGYIHFVSSSNEDKTGAYYKTNFSSDVVSYIVLPSVSVITILVLYFVNVPAISANTTLIKAMTPRQNISESLDYFKEIFSGNSFGNTEALEQIVTISSQLSSPQANATMEQKQAFFDLAKQQIEKKISQVPNDARYLVFAGSFFNRYAMYDEAIKYLERAKVESPKKQTILFELGSSYLGKGDYQKTLSLFKEAYDYKPSAKDSQILYTIGAIYAKDQKVLAEMSSKLDANTVLYDNRFVNTYVNIGDYTSAINILNTRLERNSKDADAKLTLAFIYNRIGQKDKAISIVQSIINDDPSFKDRGNDIIRQIQQS